MPAPTNITAATAAVLTMNSSVTLDVSATAAPLHEVWYTYTATTADTLVGWYAAAAAGTYVPVTAFFSGSPSSLVAAFGFSALTVLPVQMTLDAGTTYYFRVQHNGANVALTQPLQLALSRAANLAAPAGSLYINDDAPGWPMVVLSPTDGTVLQTRRFPAGETGTVLPSGLSVWHDYEVDPAVVRLYDAALTLRATPAWTFASTSPPVSSNRQDRFYLGDPGATFPVTTTARVTTMDTAGVLSGPIATLPEVGLRAIGVSRDDTVLYHTGQASGAGVIQRWDLVAHSPLTSFPAQPAGYTSVKDILVMADDTVVTGFASTSAGASVLRQSSPTGTVLHDYPLAGVQLNRITWALDDPASVWLWIFLLPTTTGVSRFQRIRLSDGVVLTTFDSVRYEGGAYRPAAPAPPPPAPAIGHSPSCPFLVLPPALPPYSPPGGGVPPDGGGGPPSPPSLEPPYGAPASHVATDPIRRLRRAPHLAQENQRVFYRRFELDLERGVGLADGQGADPLVLLRISRDGGQTWGEEQRMSAGALGAYRQRVIARRLGQARDTVFEVVVSDPVAWSLVGAWLDLEAGTN